MPKGAQLWETPPAPVHMVLSSDFSAVADNDQISELFLTAPISQFPAMVPVVTMQDPRNWWSLMAAELDSSVSMVMEMNDLVIAVAVSQLTHPSTDEERGSWEDLASHVIQYKIRLLTLIYAHEGLSCTFLQNLLAERQVDAFIVSVNPEEPHSRRTSVVLGFGPGISLRGAWTRSACLSASGKPADWETLPPLLAVAGWHNTENESGCVHCVHVMQQHPTKKNRVL